MKLFQVLLAASLFFLGLPTTVSALDFKSGDNVEVSSSAILSGTLFSTGRNLTIAANVPGDLFCAGQNVVISGSVEGDVLCAAQTIEIVGRVQGDVRAAAQTIMLSGTVEKNMTAFGQTVTLAEGAQVYGEVHTGAQRVNVYGSVGKALFGGGETVALNGSVGGDIKLEVDTLTIGQIASISGDLAYTSDTEAIIPATARISGEITRAEPTRADRHEQVVEKRSEGAFSVTGFILKTLLYALLSYVLLRVFPIFSQKVATHMRVDSGRSLLTGLAAVLLLPVAVVVLAITIVGIPLIFLLLPLFALAAYFGKLLVAYVLGGALLTKFYPAQRESLVWQVILGALALALLQKIPVLGGIVWLLALLFGLGAFVLSLPFWERSIASPTKKTAKKRLPN